MYAAAFSSLKNNPAIAIAIVLKNFLLSIKFSPLNFSAAIISKNPAEFLSKGLNFSEKNLFAI